MSSFQRSHFCKEKAPTVKSVPFQHISFRACGTETSGSALCIGQLVSLLKHSHDIRSDHELGNPGSVYMHKDRGGKLVAGPCWDFDWGVLSFRTSRQAEYDLLNDKAIWYARLFQDPAFRAKVKARFQELLPELKKIPDYMDECEKLLTESAKLNFAMWNPAEDASMNDGHIVNGDENMTFHDAVARLKSIYKERLRVIPANL